MLKPGVFLIVIDIGKSYRLTLSIDPVDIVLRVSVVYEMRDKPGHIDP
jgi:hypothetical protein